MSRELAAVIETVRHRGLQKRVSRTEPDVPKRTDPGGIDWWPCGACRDEADRIAEELARRGLVLVRAAPGAPEAGG